MLRFIKKREKISEEKAAFNKGVELYRAVLVGKTKKAISLIDSGAKVDMRCNKTEKTVLDEASAKGNIAIVEKILKCGIPLNKLTFDAENQYKSLDLAITNKHQNIAIALIEAGALENTNTEFTRKQIKRAAVTNLIEVYKKLIEKGISPFYELSQSGSGRDFVFYHPDKCDDLELKLFINNFGKPAAVRYYLDLNKIDLLIKYLAEFEESLDMVYEYGNTILIHAVKYGYVELAMNLIDKGVNLNLKNDNGNTALIHAASRGCNKVAYKLIDAGAALNITNNTGDSALIWAVTKENFQLVRKLLERKASFSLQNKRGDDALIIAIRRGYKVIANYLLEADASRDVKDIANYPPFVIAANKGNKYICEKILLLQLKRNLEKVMASSKKLEYHQKLYVEINGFLKNSSVTSSSIFTNQTPVDSIPKYKQCRHGMR